MRVLSVIGNRPQFVKAAPLARALRRHVDEVLVHTGQHYDPELSDVFFDELDMPAPDHALGIGSGTPSAQLALILQRLEPLLERERPDMVLVYGDTNSTLAGALAAAKRDIPVAHVEAGLRSFVRSMPEEQNRVVTDHRADLLFCPTDRAVDNLAREGITAGVHMVGDVMFDAALLFAPVAARREGAAAFGLTTGGYVLATVHRAAATDTPEALAALVEVLGAIGEPTVFPVHPRTRHKLEEAGLWDRLESVPGLHLAPPVGYLDFTALLVGASSGRHRLRRRPEGGVLPRHPLHHPAQRDGMGRNRGRWIQPPHRDGPRSGRRCPRRRDPTGRAPRLLRRRAGIGRSSRSLSQIFSGKSHMQDRQGPQGRLPLKQSSGRTGLPSG